MFAYSQKSEYESWLSGNMDLFGMFVAHEDTGEYVAVDEVEEGFEL